MQCDYFATKFCEFHILSQNCDWIVSLISSPATSRFWWSGRGKEFYGQQKTLKRDRYRMILCAYRMILVRGMNCNLGIPRHTERGIPIRSFLHVCWTDGNRCFPVGQIELIVDVYWDTSRNFSPYLKPVQDKKASSTNSSIVYSNRF